MEAGIEARIGQCVLGALSPDELERMSGHIMWQSGTPVS